MLRLRAPRNAAIRPHSELISVSLMGNDIAKLIEQNKKILQRGKNFKLSKKN
jgi:hypothetical protein